MTVVKKLIWSHSICKVFAHLQNKYNNNKQAWSRQYGNQTSQLKKEPITLVAIMVKIYGNKLTSCILLKQIGTSLDLLVRSCVFIPQPKCLLIFRPSTLLAAAVMMLVYN